MSNVIIAIAVMVIGFVLASYGVYENVQSGRRTAMTTTIGAKLNRLATYSQDLREDLGRMPATGEETTVGSPYYAQPMLDRERFGPVTFRYLEVGGAYWVCAISSDTGPTIREAMAKVAKDRPPSFVSGECGVSATAIGTQVVTSMRIGG